MNVAPLWYVGDRMSGEFHGDWLSQKESQQIPSGKKSDPNFSKHML